MEETKILQPNELAKQLSEMSKDDQRLLLAFAQGMMTHATIDGKNKPA